MGVPVEGLDQPLDPINLPRGRKDVPVRDFSLGMQKLWLRVLGGDEPAAQELIRRCVPSITDEEVDDLTPGEAMWIFSYCARRLHEVTEHLKNVVGAEAPSSTPLSAPMTNTSSPSPASPAPSGRTGGRKRNSRSVAHSSPLTA